MKAFILSAGRGERLGPLTAKFPKVMLPVNGKPVIEHLILLCRRYGIFDFIINLHFCPENIVNHLDTGKSLGVNISYSFEPELLGTAGAIKRMKASLKETFLVLYGDVMVDVDLSKLMAYHKRKKGVGTMVVHKSSHPHDSDLVECDKNGRIIRFLGKPRKKEPLTTLSAAGLLILEPDIFDFISKDRRENLEEIFPKVIESGQTILGYETKEYLKDMGTPERYEEVKKDFRGKKSQDV